MDGLLSLPVDRPSAQQYQRARTGNLAGRRQGIFWLLTLPGAQFVPYLPPGCVWIRGQREMGAGGFDHWQVLVAFSSKMSLPGVLRCFGPYHAEISRSSAAVAYVWKEDTRVAGTQFELGQKPIERSSKTDWNSVWDLATRGDIISIPASIRVQSYRTLRAIGADYARPLPVQRSVTVYVGPTGTGKSHRAWADAGMDAYPKDPRSKFWCGYRDQEHVVIDEFRGGVDIAHVLRWFDRYPVIVEVKGGSAVFKASKIWITSNIQPEQWYPELDSLTVDALMRRLDVHLMEIPYVAELT